MKRERAFNHQGDPQLFRTNQDKSESCFNIPKRRKQGIGHKKMSVNNNYSHIFFFFPLKMLLKPQVYICSFTPETPSNLPSHSTSRLSQNTGLSSVFYTANSHELSILHMVIPISMLFSQFNPLSPSPTVSTSLFSMSVSVLLPCK